MADDRPDFVYLAQRLERCLEDFDSEHLTLHRQFLKDCAAAIRFKTPPINDERKAFAAFARSVYWNPNLDQHGSYAQYDMVNRWRAWEARANLAAAGSHPAVIRQARDALKAVLSANKRMFSEEGCPAEVRKASNKAADEAIAALSAALREGSLVGEADADRRAAPEGQEPGREAARPEESAQDQP